MLQTPGFDFNQTYIDHGYIELCIPPVDGQVFNLISIRHNISPCHSSNFFFGSNIFDKNFILVSNGDQLLAHLATRKIYDDCTSKSK